MFYTQAGFDITKIKFLIFFVRQMILGLVQAKGFSVTQPPCKDLHSTPLGLGIKKMHILHSSPFPSDLGTTHRIVKQQLKSSLNS